MKIKIAFCLIFFINSCSHNASQETENDSKPVVAISSTPDYAVENRASQSDASVPTSQFPTLLSNETNKEVQRQKLELEKFIVELSRSCQLPHLGKAKISKEDLEVRVWRNSAWWQSDVFILRRSNAKWTADFQKQNFWEGTLKLKKISKKKLNESKSGWNNTWQQLVSEEILTLPDAIENGGSDPCPDCGNIIIETNVGGEYRFCQYTAPSPQSALRETKQVTRITQIIAKEFNLQDFTTLLPLPIK